MFIFTITFLSCWLLDRIVYAYSNNQIFSNALTCLIYQTYFLVNTMYLMFRSINSTDHTLCIKTENNLDTLLGYFFYDIFHVFNLSNWLLSFGYFFHHMLGIIMIHALKYMGIHSHQVFYYNLYCLIAEFQNPFSQLLTLSHGGHYEPMISRLYFYLYTVCRIFCFPIVNRIVYARNRHIQLHFAQIIFISSDLIYIMSLFYFPVLLKYFYNL